MAALDRTRLTWQGRSATKKFVSSWIGAPSPGGVWIDPSLSCYLNPGADCLFLEPQPGQLGALPQTPIYGPRLFTFDFSLLKRTKVTETTNFEFRWEIFNLFNNANFNIPDADITSMSFGQVLSTVTRPRLMQIALRFNW